MKNESFISNELKNKIILKETLTNEEIDIFFKYVKYKIQKIMNYRNRVDENLSKEYTALGIEILFSHNLEAKPKFINNHFYCTLQLNDKKYLCDFIDEKYNYLLLTKETQEEYEKYINIKVRW